mmetsp:Transcript_28905/g.65382  ORF Transcript_28905/g.65382 Transcript_28905/m.65382 type:complete len:183 (-) Transcript_28905:48-596(-)
MHAESAGYQDARNARQKALQDAVRGIVLWVTFAVILTGLAWALAHVTVSWTLPRWIAALLWGVLGAWPVWCAEKLVQRTVGGLYLRGIAGDGRVHVRPGFPLVKAVLVPPLPGAPWFGRSAAVRAIFASIVGLTYVALEWHHSPLAAAIAGSVCPLLLSLRVCYIALWVCDWRLTQLWRKNK